MMFIDWLKHCDEGKFKIILLSIQDGISFRDAFSSAFGGNVQTLQREFIQSFKLESMRVLPDLLTLEWDRRNLSLNSTTAATLF